MRELKPSKRADPAFLEAFRRLVRNLARFARASAKSPILLYLAGGTAMHLYTGNRFTDDVDAAFSRRLVPPRDLTVFFSDSEGVARTLFFDSNYNETFALMHEDAHADAMRLPVKGIPGVHVCVLQPLDLAVSKLARFGDIDRQDIVQLARDGLITAEALRSRAEEAMGGYVGNPAPLRTSLEIACGDICALKR